MAQILTSKTLDDLSEKKNMMECYLLPLLGTSIKNINFVLSIFRDCNVAYVGQTKRQMGTRMREHERSQKKELVPENTPIIGETFYHKNTALQVHAKTKNHTFNTVEPKILFKGVSARKRNVLEALSISKNARTCNCRTDTKGICDLYRNVIESRQSA